MNNSELLHNIFFTRPFRKGFNSSLLFKKTYMKEKKFALIIFNVSLHLTNNFELTITENVKEIFSNFRFRAFLFVCGTWKNFQLIWKKKNPANWCLYLYPVQKK